ncbi:phosphate acetyltransferase/phosphate butyryltransferase [Shimia gijangensis]|uniref:Phosphate acetyltransferase/phosphate butyryltransferase n=1 Tax=Shimia gijangensis TaxID=1470563 RepID=A0A1M6TFD5_9RHOB|nr:bifunctional enoyl-CoA hydratase/phosphate acetyltransferase [Shimia gijangensis]SHK55584.1 phosphate acetyltransferase/phosphate butyryltransferase [Shimia gijangensis]
MIIPVQGEDKDRDELPECGPGFTAILAATTPLDPIVTAVVHPCDEASLEGALAARDHSLIEPILVGPKTRIEQVARDCDLDIKGLEIISAEHSHDAAKRAVSLVREGRAEALMKGALHTDEIMSEIVHRDRGLRTERRMSHVFVLDVPRYPKPLLITDAAINIYPDLLTKADIIQNSIELAHAMGVDLPKVAILSALETISPKIPSTVEAGALCKMADRGQISGGFLDGPLAFDNAVSKEAADTKGIVSDVAGDPDILVAPDLEAGNMMAKQLIYLAGADAAGIVLGARVPVMLTSRADGMLSRIASAALAQLIVRRGSGKTVL